MFFLQYGLATRTLCMEGGGITDISFTTTSHLFMISYASAIHQLPHYQHGNKVKANSLH